MRFVFRLFESHDSVAQLNSLLRASYKPLAEAGMRFAASWESVEDTQAKLAQGECHIALLDGRIVACAILRLPPDGAKGEENPNWYRRKSIATFGRFAVEPALQSQGLGSRMMEQLEERARSAGFDEIAFDTSEKASHLIEFYSRRGYRFIEYHQWSVTNYRSVVMSKKLV